MGHFGRPIVVDKSAQHDATIDEIAGAEFYSAAAMMAALHLALFLSKIGLAFVGLFHILSGRCSPYTAILAFWLWPFSGLGVTAGGAGALFSNAFSRSSSFTRCSSARSRSVAAVSMFQCVRVLRLQPSLQPCCL